MWITFVGVIVMFFAGELIFDFLKIRGPVEVRIRAQSSSSALNSDTSLGIWQKGPFFEDRSFPSCKFAKMPQFDQ